MKLPVDHWHNKAMSPWHQYTEADVSVVQGGWATSWGSRRTWQCKPWLYVLVLKVWKTDDRCDPSKNLRPNSVWQSRSPCLEAPRDNYIKLWRWSLNCNGASGVLWMLQTRDICQGECSYGMGPASAQDRSCVCCQWLSWRGGAT